MDPFTLGTALALGGASAAGSISQAREQNEAIRRSIASQEQAARVQARQINRQSEREAEQAIREARAIQGRLRVSRGEAGVGSGGSLALLQQQADRDATLNLNTIAANRAARLNALTSGLRANVQQLGAGLQSPGLAGVMGGVRGFTTGLSIGGGFSSLFSGASAAGAAGNIGGQGGVAAFGAGSTPQINTTTGLAIT